MEITTLPVGRNADVKEQAEKQLRAVSYFSLCDVRCEYRQGHLILRGNVSSYSEKKLAQEVVARLEGVAQVENDIEVAVGNCN